MWLDYKTKEPILAAFDNFINNSSYAGLILKDDREK